MFEVLSFLGGVGLVIFGLVVLVLTAWAFVVWIRIPRIKCERCGRIVYIHNTAPATRTVELPAFRLKGDLPVTYKVPLRVCRVCLLDIQMTNPPKCERCGTDCSLPLPVGQRLCDYCIEYDNRR